MTECLLYVKSHNLGCLKSIVRSTDVASPSPSRAIRMQRNKCFIHCAVITPVEYENLRAPGNLARQPNRKTIGIRCRQPELPIGQAEALLQLFSHKDRIFIR